MNTVSWEDIYYDLCYREEEESDINQLKTKINNVAYTSTKSIVSRVSIWYENITKRIPNGIRQGFRWNFRWVANVRVSIFIGTILLLIAAFCLLYGMSYGLQWCCLGEDFSLVAKNRMQSALASSVALVVGVYWYCGIGKVLYNGNFSGIYRF